MEFKGVVCVCVCERERVREREVVAIFHVVFYSYRIPTQYLVVLTIPSACLQPLYKLYVVNTFLDVAVCRWIYQKLLPLWKPNLLNLIIILVATSFTSAILVHHVMQLFIQDQIILLPEK